MCSRNEFLVLLMLYLFFVTNIATACQTQNVRPSKCTLPPFPDNGRYEVAGYPQARPGDELEYVYLNVSCERGHGVFGNNVLVCVQGEWATASVPQCEFACNLKQHPSVTYSCHIPNAKEFGSCRELVPAGTTVVPRCRSGYQQRAMSLMRCVDGNWNYEPQCSKGEECEWEGLKGQCVPETRCLTTLAANSPKHPICAATGEETFVCCTDCELFNNTKDVVFNKTSQLYWKIGQKARDSCLEYLSTLPYPCKLADGGATGWLSRQLDKENKCYGYLRGAVAPAAADAQPSYPHEVFVGYSSPKKNRTSWKAGGFLISDRFILTGAQVWTSDYRVTPESVAMGVKNRKDPQASWQIRKIKRYILHPDYMSHTYYNDIALIETDAPIQFNENVLPACLHVDGDAAVEDAVTTTWIPLQESQSNYADTIQTIKLEEFSDAECQAAYGTVEEDLKHNHTVEMCYGSNTSKTDPGLLCKGFLGSPLLITTQFSSCIHTAIGINSYVYNCETHPEKPMGFTRIAYYVPWIESIVWP